MSSYSIPCCARIRTTSRCIRGRRPRPDRSRCSISLARANEMEQRLRSGLGRLPRMQREVVLMRAQQGMEYEDISAALGTTVGAARVHYHHAVKRLKDMMR